MAAQPINELYEQLKSEAVKCADELLALPKDYAISAKADFWNGVVAGFKVGADWMEKQMLKEVVEGTIVDTGFDDHTALVSIPDKRYDEGDKVHIIVLKVEEE